MLPACCRRGSRSHRRASPADLSIVPLADDQGIVVRRHEPRSYEALWADAPRGLGGFATSGRRTVLNGRLEVPDRLALQKAAQELVVDGPTRPRIPHDQGGKMTNSCHKALREGHYGAPAESFESSPNFCYECASGEDQTVTGLSDIGAETGSLLAGTHPGNCG